MKTRTTYGQAYAAGKQWVKDYPNANKYDLRERALRFGEARGDDRWHSRSLEHFFFRGALAAVGLTCANAAYFRDPPSAPCAERQTTDGGRS